MKKRGILCVLMGVFLTALCACAPEAAPESPYTPKSYAEMNLLHHQSDGTEIDDYRDSYIRNPFFSNVEDSVTYTANAMYDVFTLANKWYRNNTGSGEQMVHRFGGTTPKYFEWMAQKSYWTDDTVLKEYVKTTLVNYPIMQSGQFWTWHASPRWPVSAVRNDGSFHYDDQFRFISAVKQIMMWEQSGELLSEVDTTLYSSTVDDQGNEIASTEADVSINKTVREKLDMDVSFIMNKLNGKNGLIILPGENNGKRASKSSNYFDSYAYGNKSAYENQLFYHALGDLIDIETMSMVEAALTGGNTDSYLAKIQEYAVLQAKVQENFYKEFWDAEKGRFIATIDTDGTRWDFGMVTQNLESVTYGIAAGTYEEQIMSWINGTRMVEGDTIDEATKQNADIYEFKIAPRTNTVKIETSQIREDNEWKYWWHGMPEINPATNQKWGESQVNGGILFWTSYYDLMSRFKVLGTENAMNRFRVIADEYEVDMLFRDPANATGNKWKLGVIDEFPESGLVPLAYLNGLLGIDAEIDGLHIAPLLPAAYDYAGVETVVFGGNTYKITAYRNGKLVIEGEDAIDALFQYAPQAGSSYQAVFYNPDGEILTSSALTLTNGKIAVACAVPDCTKIEIQVS